MFSRYAKLAHSTQVVIFKEAAKGGGGVASTACCKQVSRTFALGSRLQCLNQRVEVQVQYLRSTVLAQGNGLPEVKPRGCRMLVANLLFASLTGVGFSSCKAPPSLFTCSKSTSLGNHISPKDQPSLQGAHI